MEWLVAVVAALAVLAVYVARRARRADPTAHDGERVALPQLPVEFQGTYDEAAGVLVLRHVGSEPADDVRVWWHDDLGGEPRARVDRVLPEELVELPFDATAHGYRWRRDEAAYGDEEDWEVSHLLLRVRLECRRPDGRTEHNSWEQVYAEQPGDPRPVRRRHRPQPGPAA